MLFPLVESSLPEETLRAWERSRATAPAIIGDKLGSLMAFLRVEVDSELRIKLARTGFASEGKSRYTHGRGKEKRELEDSVPTATDLYSSTREKTGCIFCGKNNHDSKSCYSAKKMSQGDRNKKVREARACHRCLKTGHFARDCLIKNKCASCGGGHHVLLCFKSGQRDGQSETKSEQVGGSEATGQGSSLANYCASGVMLQTMVVMLRNNHMERSVRALVDTGSQHSYISKKAVDVLGFRSYGEVRMSHCLFGGTLTRERVHQLYDVEMSSLDGRFTTQVKVMDQERICGMVSRISYGPWIEELEKSNVKLTDVGTEVKEIHILLGADVAGLLFTGGIVRTSTGPVAMETLLGWTLMGSCSTVGARSDTALLATSLQVSNLDVQDLWKLDVIGIQDAVESKSKQELMESALEHFRETVKVNTEGRYEICLPWVEGHPPVSKNREVAERRLKSAVKKLEDTGYKSKYQQIFDEWVSLGVIERVQQPGEGAVVSYLPHRPVFKPNSSTTPIRPVFDASARSGGLPSLNDCLDKGPNLIEMLPDILLRFRNRRYGVISDIKKAFLMISVREEDRDMLRFLWMEDGRIQEYRHCRVVFGVTSSPFLLAATINYHLEMCEDVDKPVALELKKSLYVDNCVTSVDTKEELVELKETSTRLLASAKLDLRGWAWSHSVGIEDVVGQDSIVPVLGLLWNRESDELSLDLRSVFCDPGDTPGVDSLGSSGCGLGVDRWKDVKPTKRIILSYGHRVFDPLGFCCAVTLVPKIILQDLWKVKMGWDAEVPEEANKRFCTWRRDLHKLAEMKFPRWILQTLGGRKTLHVFSDASKKAYSACVFLRHESEDGVSIQLVMAKSRVAPTKQGTIPRLELLGCCIAARLAAKVKEVYQEPDIRTVFWTDSSNALYWIQRGNNWATYVWNRVQEIRKLSNPEDWRHVSGELNPADLPSRGCTATQLVESRWWEGPSWLRSPEEEWPRSEVQYDLEIVLAEKKKCVVSQTAVEQKTLWYLTYFSSYRKIVRMVGWMLRWRNEKSLKPVRPLTLEEEVAGEVVILRDVQKDFGETHRLVAQLHARKDENGLWRVKSRIVMRDDTEDFRYPILLPHDHPIVPLLVSWEHKKNHAGHQVLQSSLRERYWIPKIRRVVRSVIYSCGRCRRHLVKNVEEVEAPLPLNRVKDAAVFEVTGVDLGGPLHLKNQQKVWFVVFTCGVYRAVHLELVTSLSTEGFLQSLRRFVARRGRPSVVYSDCGTNFEGSSNSLKNVDWEQIGTEAAAQKIKWIFNSPSAPWWGGFWERMVGLVKTLSRRILGKASLEYEELATVMCDVEQVINSRPLTYISENPEDCVPLTPEMFLCDLKSHGVPDLDQVDKKALNKRLRYRQELRESLRRRFRTEYLGLLVHQRKTTKKTLKLAVDDVVLIGEDNKKRLEWKLARVLELIRGRDGVERVAKLKTANGELTRPVQRLYPLEVHGEKEDLVLQKAKSSSAGDLEKKTSSGRVVKMPRRFMEEL